MTLTPTGSGFYCHTHNIHGSSLTGLVRCPKCFPIASTPTSKDLREKIRLKVNDAFQYGEETKGLADYKTINVALNLTTDQIMLLFESAMREARIEELTYVKEQLLDNNMTKEIVTNMIAELQSQTGTNQSKGSEL